MDKKLLFTILMSLATVWAFQYYFGSYSGVVEQPGVVAVGAPEAAVVPGQPIKVPTTQELYKPLKLDIAFAEQKAPEAESITEVETDYCTLSFSNHGAVLVGLDFKEHTGKNSTPLRTVYSKGSYDDDRKKGCFLLAFEQKTPYFYKLVDKQIVDNKIELTFQTDYDHWKVNKIYTLYKDSYKIDVTIACTPKSHEAAELQPRLFFAAPYLAEISDDVINVLVWNEQKQTIDKNEPVKVKDLAWYWHTPKAMIGADDKYFVHTLVDDPSKFVQRAYVKEFDPRNIFPVLEGPVIKEARSWKLSFYFGPKLFEAFAAVDDRLEDLLSFGWLSMLCKLLLKWLSFLFNYLGNFGLAIIALTVLLKLPFTPLSMYARKKLEEYQRYQPTINKIRLKYKHDVQMQHEELMKFHKDHNISPTTQMVGCLPLLIQMPILFALYRVLNNSLDLYQAPFFGWIVDLSSKDPYYVIPVLMGISMIWQQLMTPSTDDKQRVIMIFVTIVMTVVFSGFPAGLVLYWLVNNLLTIGEDYLRKLVFR